MNNPLDPTLRELRDCGCCAGTEAQTPAIIENRPGLPALAFRAGRQPQFKATMLATLSARARVALAGLKTRENDDFSIALLDGWACVADVLTFYNERIANEAFLHTATERLSALELAREIGYELNPGVAASTWLVFTIEEAFPPSTQGYAEIPDGTRLQSIPGPGEKPQVYETLSAILARNEWNVMRPLAARHPVPFLGMTQLRLAGVTTNLKRGDALLIIGQEREGDPTNENWDFRRVQTIETFPDADAAKAFTLVTVDHWLGKFIGGHAVNPASNKARVFALRQRANFFGFNAPDWRAMPDSIKAAYDAPPPIQGGAFDPKRDEWPGFTLADISDTPLVPSQGTGLLGEYFATIRLQDRRLRRHDVQVNFDWTAVSPGGGLGTTNFSVRWTGWIEPKVTGAHTFTTRSDDGVRLWIDGQLIISRWNPHPPTDDSFAIQLERGRKYDIRLEYYQGGGGAVIALSWAYPSQAKELVPTTQLFPRDIYTVHLDAVYPAIVPTSWLVVSTPGYQEAYSIENATEDARTKFTLTAKTTRVILKGENLLEQFNERVREAAVFGQSEELPWADEPVHEPLAGEKITLDREMPELPAGRELLVSGLLARVRVTKKGVPLLLQFDGGGHRATSVGDLLTVLAAPEPVLNDPNRQRWLLRNEGGESGAVLASAGQLDGVAADPETERVFEIVRVKRIEPVAGGLPQIILEEPLLRAYDPATVEIAGNIAFATHGETVEEILGQGDASRPHQQFTLKQKPVTFVPAANAAGGETTLKVWVNDVLWHETSTLFNAGPRDRVYAARQADDGTVTLTFGDGIRGSRLPTGHDNVRARYRKGTGLEGRVKEHQLSLLLTRPLGVKSAENPRPAEGAADPEIFADARRNAPLTVLTLDRAVSLQDYEDFARAFSGVARAHAVWTWEVNARGVFVTVAGAKGALLSDDGDTIRNLARALREHGNPLVSVRVRGYRPATFRLAATVTAAADRVPETVLAAVKAALAARFSFAARDFGQPVALSEVVAVMQDVPGVESVSLEALHRDAGGLDNYLAVATPESGASAENVVPAEFLTLDETSLEDVKVRTA